MKVRISVLLASFTFFVIFFALLIKLNNDENKRALTYHPASVVTPIISTEVKVTILPGMTVFEIAELLDRSSIMREARFLEIFLSRETTNRSGFDSPTFEGYIFPGEYTLAKNIDKTSLVTEFNVVRRRAIDERFRQYDSVHLRLPAALIIASLATVELSKGPGGDASAVISNLLTKWRDRERIDSVAIADYVTLLRTKAPDIVDQYSAEKNPILPPGPVAVLSLDVLSKVFEMAAEPTYWPQNRLSVSVERQTVAR